MSSLTGCQATMSSAVLLLLLPLPPPLLCGNRSCGTAAYYPPAMTAAPGPSSCLLLAMLGLLWSLPALSHTS